MSSAIRTLFFVLTLLITLCTMPASILAATPTRLIDTITQLQKKYQQLLSIEFDFSQSTRTDGRIRQGSGNAIFYRPAAQSGSPSPTGRGIIRWNYLEPTVQTIINDGKELSIYTPQDKQLIVSSAQDMESDITFAIFTGTKSLLDEFEVAPPDKLFTLNLPPSNFEAILLIPRQPHPQVKRIQLWLNGDLTIHRLLMEDHFGALTELTFNRVRFNTFPTGDAKQLHSLLKLNLAPGTEIIRQ